MKSPILYCDENALSETDLLAMKNLLKDSINNCLNSYYTSEDDDVKQSSYEKAILWQMIYNFLPKHF